MSIVTTTSSKLKLQKRFIAPLLLALCSSSFIYATNVIIESKQKKKGFAGLAFKDGKLFICANPNHVDVFNPSTRRFEDTDFFVPNFSFADDITLSPHAYSLSSFLDGKIPTFDNGTTLIQSLTGPFQVAPETGIFHEEFNVATQGVNPIAYRASNQKLYFQAFDPSLIFSVDLSGSTTSSVTLSVPTGLNGMQFGSDDKLYAPAPGFGPGTGQIVKIDADSGNVTSLLTGLNTPIAAKISSNGIIYFVERFSANVYKFNPATHTSTLITTLEPPLDNLCLNASEKKLFVTNNQNKIYKVDISSGNFKVLFKSPITQVWDIAYDPTTNSLYLGDNGILQEVSAQNGNPIPDRSLILDSDANQFANGFGIISGLDVETTGTDATITMADITIGNILVINKSNYSFHEFFSGFETGLFTRQNFSTVRITGGTPGEYYLALDAVGGIIYKIYRSGGAATVETYFSGLSTPVKLKKYNGYLYIVEAGQLNAGVPNTGRVSRIPIQDNPPTPEDQLVLLDNLNNPQGMDIYFDHFLNDDTLLVLEVGESRLLQGSASIPSIPSVVTSGLEFTDVVLVSNLNPIPVDPMAGFATNTTGKLLYVVENGPNRILKIKNKNS